MKNAFVAHAKNNWLLKKDESRKLLLEKKRLQKRGNKVRLSYRGHLKQMLIVSFQNE